MSAFHGEDVITQGWVLGHYLVRKHREGFENEMQQADAKKKAKDKENKKQDAHPVYRHRESVLRAKIQEQQAKGVDVGAPRVQRRNNR